MRKNLTLFVAGLVMGMIAITDINAQIRTPQPSPAGTVSSVVGLTDVEINYYRPGVKGRKVFGEGSDFLVPFGQIWRTGANSGSVLSLSTDVKIGGQDVKAGEYLMITIPGKDEWQFMLYSDLSMGGNVASYDKANEVINVSVKSMEAPMTERLTFNIADISDDNTTANIQLQWEKTVVNIPLAVNFDQQVMADIASKTRVNPSNYVQAANYYLTTNRDLDQALEWVNMYLAEGENSRQFWNVHLKARILAAMGNDKEAIATAEESMKAAKASPNGDFGYVKRNEDLIKEINSK
jgi:hypothetical protein